MFKSTLSKRVVLISSLSFAIAAGAADMPSADTAAMPEIQTQNGISYVSGGVGDRSQQAMKELANKFNLRLTFAVKQGNYLAYVPVAIKDPQGNTLLETISTGPLFYANLAPGAYSVTASADGQTRTHQVSVQTNSPASLNFTW